MRQRPTRTTNETKQEGRVNVPLGKGKQELEALARKHGTTTSNLARVLIRDGIAKLASGEIQFCGPSVIPTTDAQ
jgi:hypothetical protein